MTIRISLTESLSVEANGARVDEQRFPGRQGRILFAYLAAQKGRPVPRDELAELLWGDALPATWEKALRVLMTKLRAVLEECGVDGSRALTSAFGCYRLDLPEAWIDVDAAVEALERAEAELAVGDLVEARAQAAVAATLARRSFLPGEEGVWVEERRRDLRDVLVRALECLRGVAARAGDHAEAVRRAEELTELEPYRESGYRALMQAHVAAGDPAEALRVYDRCRRFLAEELGAYPAAETEALYKEALQDDRRATAPVGLPALAAPAAPTRRRPQTRAGPVQFRILGPVDLVGDGTALAVGRREPRALLAVLLLARGEVVPIDRLVGSLWGEQPPASATKTIQVNVSNLRKALGDRLETRGEGYRLRIGPGELDAAVFETLLRDGRERLAAGDAEAAAALLSEALGLWRGPALADFAYERFAQSEVARLEELRATALEAYRRAREALVSELGGEPGPELRDIHAAVLRRDPEPATATPASTHVRARRRGGVLVALGGATIGAAIVAAVLAMGGETNQPVPVRALTGALCSPLQQGTTGPPDLLVVADQDLRGLTGPVGNQVAAAVEFVLRRRDFRAGAYAVGYQVCDGSESDRARGDPCGRNAIRYARNRAVVAVIGPTTSMCAATQIPVANRAPDGPLAIISPSNTRVGLTRRGPGAEPGEPAAYYPTGARNYVRMMPADDLQGAAHALLAERLGSRRAFVVDLDGGDAISSAFSAAAAKVGVQIVGRGYGSDWSTLRPTLGAAAAARPDTVLIAGGIGAGGGVVAEEMRKVLGPDVRLLGADGFAIPGLRELAKTASEGMLVSIPGVAPVTLQGRGRRIVENLEAELGHSPDQWAVHGAQAAEVLLDAIGRSDGTRSSVARELLSTRVKGGILGDFAVTETGDTTATHVSMYRVSGGRLRFVEVLRPPANLLTGG